ncbi:TPA: restriction endonuclease subunit S [Escherichia coli]|uniref:restriction endonuclease subunit S n=1 Tax=Escherichia coli TaxID=562 RepID=UPI00157C7337|nr:restriction endonuclease subunit S [Escherichia coli]EGB0163820.1 restriction endonuclease subunit S [Escherichia coli]NUD39205.1 restriction endonuclease subunit S [Escherichia coli]HDK8898860.1 restriction endonuclease subunit S [Escherichia coli]HEB9000710.1 restriction endonuclease subunit S [Escherichia coli]
MVPKGWEKNSLDSLFEFKNGLNTEKEQYGNGYKFVNVMDVFRNDILTESKIIGRVQVTDKQLEGYQLKYGDVLFNRTSETFDEIAIAAIYLDNAIATFGGFVIRARPKGNQIDPAYSVFLFQSKSYRSQVVKLGQGAIRANIGQKDLARVCILVPPLAEQKKIAQILSTWDKAISVTEKLLTNSQQQKKALMQQLLTGKKRLLDEDGVRFSGEWVHGQLGDLCAFKGGFAFKEVYQGQSMGELPFIKVSDMNLLGNERNIEYSNNWVSFETAKLMKAKPFPESSIVFAKVGAALLLNRRRILLRPTIIDNNMMAAVPSNAADTEFLYQLLMAIDFARFVQEGAVPSINQGDLSSFKLSYPYVEEQQKIAAVLSAADAEISTLEKKLACLKDEKKALMQQLLTGKRRVKVDAEEAVSA